MGISRSKYVAITSSLRLGFGLGLAPTPDEGGLPPLPQGFRYSVLPTGEYEVWPDGAYVVEYVG